MYVAQVKILVVPSKVGKVLKYFCA